MSRFLSALVASALLLAASPALAQTSMSSPSAMKHDSMSSSSAMKHDSMSSMSHDSMKSTKSCPKGETMVKGYTKKDGTKVASYCRKAK
jgi:pentapeptide MXKDX repeat protein